MNIAKMIIATTIMNMETTKIQMIRMTTIIKLLPQNPVKKTLE